MQSTTSITQPVAVSFAPSATTWLKLAIAYLIVGVGFGIAMGATENFTLRPVHAHINLLGWTTMALAGLIYSVFPKAAASRLATIHFWLHNSAFPVMMASLTVLLLGDARAIPFLIAGEMVAAVGVIAFACNIFFNVELDSARSARMPQRA